MALDELMRQRIKHVQDTGQPLRPAYNEIKIYLACLTALGIVALLMNAAALGWFLLHHR